MSRRMGKQRGEGLGGLMMGVIVVVAVAMLGLRLFPMAKEKFEVDAAMESVAQTSGTGTTKEDLIKRLMRQFGVANVTRFTEASLMNQLKVGSVPGRAGRVMVLSYDLRAPLFGDFYLGLAYNKSVRLPGDAE